MVEVGDLCNAPKLLKRNPVGVFSHIKKLVTKMNLKDIENLTLKVLNIKEILW